MVIDIEAASLTLLPIVAEVLEEVDGDLLVTGQVDAHVDREEVVHLPLRTMIKGGR